MPLISLKTPALCCVYVMPSGDVTMIAKPPATNCVPDHVTLDRPLGMLVALGVQEIPSAEVRMTDEIPWLPTTTNFVPFQAIPCKASPVPDLRVVQVDPSGEVMMVPKPPTETNCEPDQTTFPARR